jgi:uncharacterized protein
MEFFVYCRDKPGAATQALRTQLTEAHWSFMDRYAAAMIARGPTLTADRTTATGSMHIVDLPDADAARVFAFDEPYFAGGVFAEVLVSRWRNVLGRTMWDFDGDTSTNQRFLILGHAEPGMTATHDALLDAHRRHLARYSACFIARGPLLSDNGAVWNGSAFLVEFPDRGAVEAMLGSEPFAQAGLYSSIEVHDWQFGGRR